MLRRRGRGGGARLSLRGGFGWCDHVVCFVTWNPMGRRFWAMGIFSRFLSGRPLDRGEERV